MRHRALALAGLLALAGCTTPAPIVHNIGGEVPRDAHGEPILAQVRPPPAPEPPPPAAVIAAVAATQTTAAGAAVGVPPASVPASATDPAVPPAPKPQSCKHLRRCP